MKGIVQSGLGQGSYWINKFNPIFIKTNNMKLFPGTLNIKIEHPYKIDHDFQVIEGKYYGGTDEVLVKECRLLNEKAYIVRPSRNNEENGDHPLDIIEVVSDVNFRKKYNLQDNDEVEIEI